MSLRDHELDYLRSVLTHSRTSWPAHWQAWALQGCAYRLGLLPPDRAASLARAMPSHMPLVPAGNHWEWQAAHCSADERSEVLQSIAQKLRARGELHGWRDELYACWGCREDDWPYPTPALFRLERAAFRYFGLRSHASNVNGITVDGRIWCGRRALNKATDPGMLDNLAAGGLPSGEDPLNCAVREVHEEAGLEPSIRDFRFKGSEIVVEDEVPEGWHSERLFVYDLLLADDERPLNRDGEVLEFLCLGLSEVVERIRAGEFTPDAACAIAKSALSGEMRLFD